MGSDRGVVGLQRWGTSIVLITAMMLAAIPAGAHGVHGTVPAMIGEHAGPYQVSLWIEYDNNEQVRASAEIASEGSVQDPDLWVIGADGIPRHLDQLLETAGSWTVQFDSALGDTLLVSWTTATGERGERAFIIDEMATPRWLQATLIVITVPGLWFVTWLWRRRVRVFGTPVMV